MQSPAHFWSLAKIIGRVSSSDFTLSDYHTFRSLEAKISNYADDVKITFNSVFSLALIGFFVKIWHCPEEGKILIRKT